MISGKQLCYVEFLVNEPMDRETINNLFGVPGSGDKLLEQLNKRSQVECAQPPEHWIQTIINQLQILWVFQG